MHIFLTVVLFIGCNTKERDKEKVDEYNNIFINHKYREVLSDYKDIISEINDTTEIFRAKRIYSNSKYIVDQVDSLLLSASIYYNHGFNLTALRCADEAINLYPNDSLTKSFILNAQKDKNPKFKVSGVYRSARFDYIFHTIWKKGIQIPIPTSGNVYHLTWKKEELIPSYVDITVTNLNPGSATSLGFFVPSFYYMEVNEHGASAFVAVANYYRWSSDYIFNKPIYYNQSITGRVTYSDAFITKKNTDITIEEIFEKIIIGDDSRFFLNIVGTRNTRFNGLVFVGYE